MISFVIKISLSDSWWSSQHLASTCESLKWLLSPRGTILINLVYSFIWETSSLINNMSTIVVPIIWKLQQIQISWFDNSELTWKSEMDLSVWKERPWFSQPVQWSRDKQKKLALNCNYFLIICCGCSKEPSHWDDSFEYPQNMFWLRNKKNNFQIQYTLICKPEVSYFCKGLKDNKTGRRHLKQTQPHR